MKIICNEVCINCKINNKTVNKLREREPLLSFDTSMVISYVNAILHDNRSDYRVRCIEYEHAVFDHYNAIEV